MPIEVIFTPAAEDDVAAAYAWYEERRVGLGEDFLSRIEAAVETVGRNPDAYAKVYEDFRRVLIRRFPHVLFYEHSHDVVTVYAVFHVSRNPDHWQRRLP